jgi:hypothetical protein
MGPNLIRIAAKSYHDDLIIIADAYQIGRAKSGSWISGPIHAGLAYLVKR